MARTKLSIIILSYNTEDLLKLCLRSVKIAIKEINTQVIVVDNASKDDSAEMVGKQFPWVELIVSEENLGYSGGNNLGIRKVRGGYVLFLNSDVEIKKNSLMEIMNYIEKDRKIGAVTPKVNLFNGEMDPDCHRGFPTPWASIAYFLGFEKLFPRSKFFGRYHMGYEDMNKAHEIDAGFGTFMLVRKRVFDEVGLWDDKYFFYGEDLDLFYRIKNAGWKVMFFPKVLALHHKGASSGLRKESKKVTKADRETTLKTARASIKAWEIFYKKFYKNRYNPLITIIVILGIRIKGLIRLITIYLSTLLK
jgi:GT2 family glycosyltransferase